MNMKKRFSLSRGLNSSEVFKLHIKRCGDNERIKNDNQSSMTIAYKI